MDDEKPKLSTWDFNSQDINNTPELQKPTTTSMSSIGESMARDTSENVTTKWYFNTPVVVAVFLIGILVSKLVGVILVFVVIGRIILSIKRNNKSSYRIGSIIGWALIGLLMSALILIF